MQQHNIDPRYGGILVLALALVVAWLQRVNSKPQLQGAPP